jgi:hypothetical protein
MKLQSALFRCFQVPGLAEVSIQRIYDIPIDTLARFPYLKKLSLDSCSFVEYSNPHRPDTPTIPLTRLEALEFLYLRMPIPAAPLQLIRNLRHIGVLSCDLNTVSTAQEVMHSSAATIKSVTWEFAGPGLACTVLCVQVVV